MLITFEINGEEYEMYVDPTAEEIINFYGKMVEEETYEEDEDFVEWLREEHQNEAENEYDECMELNAEYRLMETASHYW